MAHESTHVVQQDAAQAVRPAVLQRLSIADIPGSDLVMDGVRAIPGYRLLSVVIGEDPLTGEDVTADRAEFVQVLLGYGPFAGAVGPVLQAMDALDEVFDLINVRLAANNLTLARVSGDMSAAWDEMDLARLDQSPNVEIAARYVRAFIADVKAFVTGLVADLIAAVREAAVAFAEPLVQSPEVKPVWDLGVKVFHYDPLKDEEVNAPTVEILADFLKLIGQEAALAQMQERGTLQQTADWLDTQFATFNDLLGQARALFADAWAAIAPENLANLVENIQSLTQRAYGLLRQVGAFATTVIAQVLALVKKSLLGMLSDQAHKIPGFHLLTVILGRNPFTGDPVARTAENLIKGFILLLPNGEQMYAQLAESGVIAEAAGRIETAMTELNISWDLITGTFKAIWDGLQLSDLLDPIGAFMRILDQFGEPLGRIVSFAATVIGVVIELILKLLNFPSELLGNVIANARSAIDDIKRDPVEFLKNIVLAMKQGVVGFLDKIGTCLLQGLTDWLFRGLRTLGIEPPADLSLQGIITLVLQVLGVSVETLWTKLAAKIGPEKVAKIRALIDKAGQAWAFVKDVQERGISAVWEFISGQLSNRWDMILNKAKDWIMSEIIDKVTAKLISMLDPTGVMAVINSCIAFFNAVQSAIEYIREILQIVDRYVSTIASIARGNVGPGAKMLEEGLASSVPVAIGFLANQVGLGNVPEKVVEIVQSLRELVDQALDWLFDQAWRLGQAALDALGLGGGGDASPVAIDVPFENEGLDHHLRSDGSGGALVIHSDPLTVASLTDPQVAALNTSYEAARAAYVAETQVTPPNPEATASKKAAMDAIVAQIALRLGALHLTGMGMEAAVPLLTAMGLSAGQIASFFQGAPVTYTTGAGVICIAQMQPGLLRVGIFSINIKDDPSAAIRGFAGVRGPARQLAKALAVAELELFGAAVLNEDIEKMLIRQGFSRSTETVPESMGLGPETTIEMISKRFPVG